MYHDWKTTDQTAGLEKRQDRAKSRRFLVVAFLGDTFIRTSCLMPVETAMPAISATTMRTVSTEY